MGIIAERWLADERVQLSVQRATGARRLTGLVLSGAPAPGEAMRFTRCRSVHGLGMRRVLDVVFVSGDGVVTSVARLRPWRVAGDRSAAHAFELRAGEAARLGIAPGSRFRQIRLPRGGAAPGRRELR